MAAYPLLPAQVAAQPGCCAGMQIFACVSEGGLWIDYIAAADGNMNPHIALLLLQSIKSFAHSGESHLHEVSAATHLDRGFALSVNLGSPSFWDRRPAEIKFDGWHPVSRHRESCRAAAISPLSDIALLSEARSNCRHQAVICVVTARNRYRW